MRDSMIQLSGFLGRHRRWSCGLGRGSLVALPIASHQTDHLTGGGFDVPGSQSKAVTDSLQSDFGASPAASPCCSRPTRGRAGGSGGGGRAGARGGRRGRRPHPAAGRGAPRRAALQRTGTALLPLRSEQTADELIDSASTLREDLDPGTAENGVTTYLAGQPTIWAGMQELSKEDLAKAEAGGFPIVA